MKTSESKITLWDNYDHYGKLSTLRQQSQIKVVINESGTNLKAAILCGPVIVEQTLYYIPFKTIEEAQYLCGCVQAPSIQKDVNYRQAEGAGGGGRHICRRSLEYSFPKFNPKLDSHLQIVQTVNEMELESHTIASEYLQIAELREPPLPYGKYEEKVPIQRIRSAIRESLVDKYAALDILVLELLEKDK